MCAIAASSDVDDAHREDQIEVLGVPVVLGGGGAAPRAPRVARSLRTPRSSTPSAPSARDERRQRTSPRSRDRPAASRARCTRRAAATLAFSTMRDRHGRGRRRVDVDVADALVVLDDRDARVLGDEADQALAAARDARGRSGRRACTQLARSPRGRWSARAAPPRRASPPAASPACTARSERAVALRAPREPPRRMHALPALRQSAAASVGHVRARLVDHRDHAERDAHAPTLEAVRPRLGALDCADQLGRAAISRTARDSPAIRASSRRRRSSIAREPGRAAGRRGRAAFAARISARAPSIASAIAGSAACAPSAAAPRGSPCATIRAARDDAADRRRRRGASRGHARPSRHQAVTGSRGHLGGSLRRWYLYPSLASMPAIASPGSCADRRRGRRTRPRANSAPSAVTTLTVSPSSKSPSTATMPAGSRLLPPSRSARRGAVVDDEPRRRASRRRRSSACATTARRARATGGTNSVPTSARRRARARARRARAPRRDHRGHAGARRRCAPSSTLRRHAARADAARSSRRRPARPRDRCRARSASRTPLASPHALDVGQDDERVGRDQVADQRGELIVVAELDLLDRDRVVLVDDRHHAELEQRAQRVARVGKRRRSPRSSGVSSTCAIAGRAAPNAAPSAASAGLADRRRGLLSGIVRGRSRRPSWPRPAAIAPEVTSTTSSPRWRAARS